MTNGALTVATFPHDTVRLRCDKCGRKGQCRQARLIERFGPDAAMPDVLRELADCPRWGKAHDPCQAIYSDFVNSADATPKAE